MNIKCCIYTAQSGYNQQCRNNAVTWIVVEHNPDKLGPVCGTHKNMVPEKMHTIKWDHVRNVNTNPQEDTMENVCPGCGSDDENYTCRCAPTQEELQLNDETVNQRRVRQIQELREQSDALMERMGQSRVVSIINEGEPGVYEVDPEVQDALNGHGQDFIVAGTGSRSLQKASKEDKEQVMATITNELNRLKEKYGDRLVIMSGMAEGFDKALAMVALDLGIRLWCAIPNRGYGDYYWGRNSLTRKNMMHQFNAIVDKAEKVVYVMEDIHNVSRGLYLHGRHSNFVRNDYMVETADAFLVWDPTSSGTKDCVASIIKASKPFKVLK